MMNTSAIIAGGTAVSLEQILTARERRAARQSAALARFEQPLVSMTVVMPGPVKDGLLPRRVLEVAAWELNALAGSGNWPVLSREVLWPETGPEAIYVIAPGPRLLSRKQLSVPARRCLVCERPAFECGRSRRHPVEELLGAIRRVVNEYDLCSN